MNQARIVLRGAALKKAEQLQELTQLGSVSEVINVLFSRYAKHLEETWEVKPMTPSYTQLEPQPDATTSTTATMPENDFSFDEPLIGL